MRVTNRLVACSSLLLLFASVAPADDWPQWRGANRDGQWHETGIVDHFESDQLSHVWRVPIGAGYSGPTVADGRVFVTDRLTEPDQTERVHCFDARTGEAVWSHEYPCAYTVGYKAGPRASVTVSDGRAYSLGAMGHFHCLDANTGSVVWRRDLEADYDIDMPEWGIAAAPLVYGDLVIQVVAGAEATLVAFDRTSGREVWTALAERAGYSAPIIVQQAGVDVLVCWTGESLSGLDPADGKLHWTHPMPSTRMPIGIVAPTVHQDHVFVSSFYDGSLMVKLSQTGLTSELVWRARGVDEKSTGSKNVEVAGGTLESDDPVFGIHTMIGSPVLTDDSVYAVDSYGEMRCLDAATGRRVWEDLSVVPRNRWATVHMVRHNSGKVWMFNEAGELMIAELSPAGVQIHSRAQLIEPTRVQLNRRDGVCWSHPAFAEKSVFVRNDEKLVKASLDAADFQ